MLVAPASTAAPPRANSSVSCNPAVPPPPVLGAAVGSALAGELGGADVGADCVTGGDSGVLAGGLLLWLAAELAVLPDDPAGVGEADPAGENEVGAAEGVEPPEQAETAAEARMVMVLQPMTANLALSPAPAMAVRTFIEPPHASGNWRPRFRVPAPEAGPRKRNATRPLPRRPETDRRKRRWP